MPIQPNVLREASALFKGDDGSLYHDDRFVQLHSCLNWQLAVTGEDHPALPHTRAVTFDVWSLLVVVLRTDWQQHAVRSGALNQELWREFISSDVEHFHTTLRSLFDHIAAISAIFSTAQGQVPDTFERLRNWARKETRSQRILGSDLRDLLLSAEWFEDVRRVRDAFVHEGALTIGFILDDRPCFQVHSRLRREIVIPEVMANDNVVDLITYLAVVFAYLLVFLDNFGAIVRGGLPPCQDAPIAMSYHGALCILRSWIMDTLQRPMQPEAAG